MHAARYMPYPILYISLFVKMQVKSISLSLINFGDQPRPI